MNLINNLFIHYNSKDTFLQNYVLLPNGTYTNILGEVITDVPESASCIKFDSIVFIKSSNEIWTHGSYYGIANSADYQSQIDAIKADLLANYATNESVTEAIQIAISELSSEVTGLETRVDALTTKVNNLESQGYDDTEIKNRLTTLEAKEIPSKTSQLTNDSGFITEHQDISNLATKEEVTQAVNTIDLSAYATKKEYQVKTIGIKQASDYIAILLNGTDELAIPNARKYSDSYQGGLMTKEDKKKLDNIPSPTLIASKTDLVGFASSSSVTSIADRVTTLENKEHLTINPEDKVLSVANDTISSELSLTLDNGLTRSAEKYLKLKGKNGVELGSINIADIATSGIQEVNFDPDTKILTITFVTSEGVNQNIEVDFNDIVQTYDGDTLPISIPNIPADSDITSTDVLNVVLSKLVIATNNFSWHEED